MRIEIRGVERLSFRERQVVALKETGTSNEAVAKRLGIGVGSVTTLFNRARKKGYQVVMVLEGDPLALYDTVDPAEDDAEPEEEPPEA